MKTRSYIHTLCRTLLCLLAALTTAACADRLETPDTPATGQPDAEPGSIVLSLAGLSASRSTSEGTEKVVEQLDVLMFLQEDGSDAQCVYHRRFHLDTDLLTCSKEHPEKEPDGSYKTYTYTHYAVLGHKVDFEPDKSYYVYVLANTHADAEEGTSGDGLTAMQEKLDKDFPLTCSHSDQSDGTMANLKTFVYTTANIHLSGDENNKPDVFLMDGMVDETAKGTAVLNNGNMLEPCELYAELRRAAAKVTVTLTADPEKHTVMLPEPSWAPGNSSGIPEDLVKGQVRYEWQNVHQREDTYLVTPDNYKPGSDQTTDFPATGTILKSPDPTAYNITVKDGLEGTFTAVTYSYSHYWDNTSSSYENASYLTVRVPLFYCAEGIPADFDYKKATWTADNASEAASGTDKDTEVSRYTTTVTVGGTERTIHYYVANYYKIPLGKDGRMDRNTHYYVTGNLTRPGSTTADKPLTLPEINFQVVDWLDVGIEAGGDQNLHYLFVNRQEYDIRNVNEDHTLTFSSSHPVKVTVKRVWYVNKKGESVDLMNPDGTFVTSVMVENNDGVDVEKTYTDDEIPNVHVEWDEEKLVGPIGLYSNNPVNNLMRHIELEVTNTAGDHAEVTIHQYPLDYIQFTEGWYSYWSSDNRYHWSNYEYYREDVNDNSYKNYFTNALWENNTWKPRVGDNASHHFRPRFFKVEDKKIYNYWYDKNTTGEQLCSASSSLKDHRMYHIEITSTSEDYVLARPKLDEYGHTAAGADNAKRVSPSFMINSQLGAVNNVIPDEEAARQYAAQYAEVYKDEETSETYVYDDWRLPTPAEIEITMKFQGTKEAPSESMYMVMDGWEYYTSNGLVKNDHFINKGLKCLRLVRDVFSPEDVKGRKVSDIFGEGSGYTKRQ